MSTSSTTFALNSGVKVRRVRRDIEVAPKGPGTIIPVASLQGRTSEFFTEYGLALKAHSPIPNTMFVGYTNDHIGYIPSEDSWMSGAYGTTPATYACLVKGTGKQLLQKVLAMLLGIWNPPAV